MSERSPETHPPITEAAGGNVESQDQPYCYRLADGGFEIVNGGRIYNRPLYGPHCRDLASFEERLLAIVGDSPDALLILSNWRRNEMGSSAAKLGHFFLGLRGASGGKWLRDCATIKARYVPGHQDYELRDPLFGGMISISYVRPVACEGLLARARLPADAPGCELVFACGGATEWGDHLDYQGGRGSLIDFHSEHCEDNEVRLEGQTFSIRRPNDGHGHRLRGALAGPALRVGVGDAGALTGDPFDLIESKAGTRPMAIGACALPPAGEVYFILTTDDLNWGEVQAYLTDPAAVFEACCRHYRDLSRTVAIATPDHYLDLGFAAQVLAVDGAWHEPCFTHGPWSWSLPFGGWRVCYGPTVLGWHERVQSSTAEFFREQIKTPEFPSIRCRPDGYSDGHLCRGALPEAAHSTRRNKCVLNPGEVLVDHILYDWEWTGDLVFMARVFEHIADKLLWEERCLDADGDGLYENVLNTWVSDAHWYSGSGCIQASVYNWRANQRMAEIAARLGKDPAVFRQRAARIKRACDTILWCAAEGIYAEYREEFGHRRLHKAPEQASIYHPIDFRFCDDLRSYQMLRFTESALRNEIGATPRGGRLVWSSNWLPPLYSSLGLYPQETINLMLCYYRLGLAEKADALLKGIEASFFNGPCPGGLAHIQRPDGSHYGSTDFTDTTSMFIRSVVEGLFGVQMNVPDGRVGIQPCFPRDWSQASLQAPDIAYDYLWDGQRECLSIRTPRALCYRVRLKARTAQVASVKLDGRAQEFRCEPGIGGAWVVVETPASLAAELEIGYRPQALAALEFSPVAALGDDYRVGVRDGRIVEIADPQGVLRDARLEPAGAVGKVAAQPGWHTFFALTENGELRAWRPVDVEVRPPLEIVRAHLQVENGKARCSCALRNNMATPRKPAGRFQVAGATLDFECKLPPVSESDQFTIPIADPARLSPGSNCLLATVEAPSPATVEAVAVDWQLAARFPAVAAALRQARPIPLGQLCNVELVNLHRQSYLAPRPKTFCLTTAANGRAISCWDETARGVGVVDPRTDRLGNTGGIFRSDIGVPFAVPETGCNACFTSLWENFPPRIVVPIKNRARKLFFLLAAVTNPMQSRIENASR
jgi:hypothetical protein